MTDREISKLRPIEEIQVAHNFLAMLAVDRKLCAEVMDDEGYQEIRIALSVLCWVLQHDNPEFVLNLDAISRAVKTAIAEEVLKTGR